jgi:predicted YcjX-like family ATPase
MIFCPTMYSLRPIKSAILPFEKNLTKNAILENRFNYLPHKVVRSDFHDKTCCICKQMRVLKSFLSSTNLS